ncbi:MAG: hemerythrin domain-containing protein [Sterolibacteriaceae bacterium]|nr:hemerythrin domain-containing protein [Sterolibacteriaceae bacterium]
MANRVDWNPRHAVGNEILDAQHRDLLARCNALGDCLAAGGPDTDPEADRRFDLAFEELMALARAHFAAEEALLAARGFAGLDSLRNEFEEFNFLAAEIVTPANFDRQELQTFLSLWWAGHVAGTAGEHRASLAGPPAESP